MEALLLVVVWFLVYFLPTIIAYKRGHASKHSILFWNFILGWTGIVWLICFGWSLGNKGQSVNVVVNNSVGSVSHGGNHKGN